MIEQITVSLRISGGYDPSSMIFSLFAHSLTQEEVTKPVVLAIDDPSDPP
jgi:hypothetical protein